MSLIIISEKLKKKLELSGNDYTVEELHQHANYAFEANHESGMADESYASDNYSKLQSSSKGKREKNSSGKSKPPKMRQKKSRSDEDETAQDIDDTNGSLMKRRRKTELQISVSFYSCWFLLY